MPARIKRSASSPLPRRAKNATVTAVAKPAAKPRAGTNGIAIPIAIASAVASAAPELIPVRNGSTSGLRSMPCKRKPETASAAPTSAAMDTRGARSCQTIVATSPLA